MSLGNYRGAITVLIGIKSVSLAGPAIKKTVHACIQTQQEAQCLASIEALLSDPAALQASDIYEVMKSAAEKNYWRLVDFFLKQPTILPHAEMLSKPHDITLPIAVLEMAVKAGQWKIARDVWPYCRTDKPEKYKSSLEKILTWAVQEESGDQADFVEEFLKFRIRPYQNCSLSMLHMKIIKLLFQYDVKPEMHHLMDAVQHRQWAFVEFFVQHSDNLQTLLELLSGIVEIDSHWESGSIRHIWTRCLDIQKGHGQLEEKNDGKQIPDLSRFKLKRVLVRAAERSDHEFVQALLAASVLPSPLCLFTPCAETLKILIKYRSPKGEPLYPSETNDCGETPIVTAAKKGRWDLVKIFAENYPLTSSKTYFHVAAMQAIDDRQYEIVDLLFKNNKEFYKYALEDRNQNFLHRAILLNDSKMLEILLKYEQSFDTPIKMFGHTHALNYVIRAQRWELVLEFVRSRYVPGSFRQIAFHALVVANQQALIMDLVGTPKILQKVLATYDWSHLVGKNRDMLHLLMTLGANRNLKTEHHRDGVAVSLPSIQGGAEALQYVSNLNPSLLPFIEGHISVINECFETQGENFNLPGSASDRSVVDEVNAAADKPSDLPLSQQHAVVAKGGVVKPSDCAGLVLEYAYGLEFNWDSKIQALCALLRDKQGPEVVGPLVDLLQCAGNRLSENTQAHINGAIITLSEKVAENPAAVLIPLNTLLQTINHLSDEAHMTLSNVIRMLGDKSDPEKEEVKAVESRGIPFFQPLPQLSKIKQQLQKIVDDNTVPAAAFLVKAG